MGDRGLVRLIKVGDGGTICIRGRENELEVVGLGIEVGE